MLNKGNVFKENNTPDITMHPAGEDQKESVSFEYQKMSGRNLEILANALDTESYANLKKYPGFNIESCKSYTEIKHLENHPVYGTCKKEITYTATKACPIFVFNYGDWQKIYQPLVYPKQFRYRYVGNYIQLRAG